LEDLYPYRLSSEILQIKHNVALYPAKRQERNKNTNHYCYKQIDCRQDVGSLQTETIHAINLQAKPLS
jgi:hypothetical protein